VSESENRSDRVREREREREREWERPQFATTCTQDATRVHGIPELTTVVVSAANVYPRYTIVLTISSADVFSDATSFSVKNSNGTRIGDVFVVDEASDFWRRF
jgi:hypothetical protein